MSGRDGLETRWIGGFDVVATDADQLVASLRTRLAASVPTELMFANTNFIMSCRSLQAALDRPDTLIVNDGIGMDLASWMQSRTFFPANLAGTDFVPRLLREVGRPIRLFLLGSQPTSIAGAAAAWSALERVHVVDAIDGYGGMADAASVVARIRDAQPDILLVALGDPRQAQWIVAHRGQHGVPLVVGVGALFDFVAGTFRRAPDWVRRARLEWLYRLINEPRRLLRRYSIDLVAFFVHCRAARLARDANAGSGMRVDTR